MKLFYYTLLCATFLITCQMHAQPHYRICEENTPEECEEQPEQTKRRWHQHHHYRDMYEDSEDPTEELDHNAAWPGKREDFSDQLFDKY